MATAAAKKSQVQETIYEWEGKDRQGKIVRGEMRAGGEAMVGATLRRQGILVQKVKKRKMASAKRIKPKDIAIFTRQLATMMKAGVPLLQAFDIVGRGNPNPSVTKLLNDIRSDVETGTSLSAAFRKHPLYFNSLYCNLVEAGEAAGILEGLLDRLATYMEKTEALKSKIKSALMYPIAVVIVAFVVVAIIMIFVIPSFKEVFSSFGADLPAPTLIVIAMSEFFVAYWWAIFGIIGFVWMRLEMPPAPMLLGFVLGPLMEENLRRALLISRGDWSVFVTRPLSASLRVVAAILLIVVLMPSVKKKREDAFVED